MTGSVHVIDAGNTDIKVHRLPLDGGLPDFGSQFQPGAVGAEGEAEVFRRSLTDTLNDPTDLWAQLAAGGDSPVLVSVIPAFTELFLGRFPTGVVAGLSADVPFPHGIEGAESVGPDRWINVAAAVGANLRSALIVDAGTATTIDLLLEGRFVGGLIAPGMAFAARKLAEHGAMLPEVPFGPQPRDVGRNTIEALERGAWLVGTGGIEHTLQILKEKYGPLPVILTGGLGFHLQREGRHHDALWTARGAAWWARRVRLNRS